MRITGGNAARRILKVPKGLAVRPTPDLVKQAVFNSLGSRVEGARVLELFAGTGALSLECLSRGAVSAVCVEKSSRHAEVLRQNLQLAGFPTETLQVRVQDVFAALDNWSPQEPSSTWCWPTRLTVKKTLDAAPLPSPSDCWTK